jgi:hypothetical protein
MVIAMVFHEILHEFLESFWIDPRASASSLLVQASSGAPGFAVANVWISQNANLFFDSTGNRFQGVAGTDQVGDELHEIDIRNASLSQRRLCSA